MGDNLYSKKEGGTIYGWFFDPRLGKARYICLRTKDKRVARIRLRDAERAAYDSRDPTAHGPPYALSQALEDFLTAAASHCAPATVDMYRKKSGHLVRILGSSTDINSLEIDGTQNYISKRLEEGAARETVRKELSTLRQALEHAFERGVLRVPAATLFPRFRVRYVPRDRYLTETEFATLLKILPEKRRLFLQLAVHCGGRFSELFAIRWDHVDLKAGWMTLPGTKTETSRRRVPMSPELKAVLKRARQDSGAIVERWTNIRRDLAKACEKAGIARVTPNDLRRTFSSWLKQRGVDSAVVARLLGHSSTRMVDLVYGRLNDETLVNAVSLLPRRRRRRRS